ncbi:AAA family ATPase [Streptococcus suis]|nr:AAA family ATPase [Streptococcus suis]
MTVFRVGNSSGSLSFDAAYFAANDGDTLQFERGYKVEKFQEFIFEKSLNLTGNIGVSQNGQRSFSNLLQGHFVISNDVKVTIKNFWLNPFHTEKFFLTCLEGSELVLETVFFNNSVGESLGFIYVGKESKVRLIQVETKANGVPTFSEFTEGSYTEILNSPKFNARVEIDRASLFIKNSRLKTSFGNVLLARNHSKVKLSHATIESIVSSEEDIPALWFDESDLYVENSTVLQEEHVCSVALENGSRLELSETTVPSVLLSNSAAYSYNTTIQYVLNLNDYSYFKSNGTLTLPGELESKIEVYLDGDSSLVANELAFVGKNTPTIHLSDNSFGFADRIYCPHVDGEIDIRSDETSNMVQKNITDSSEQADDIEEDSLEILNSMVGLTQVKNMVEQMVNQVKANQKRIEQGLKPMNQTLNAVFLGNPGTGKTTVARLLGKILYQNGALAGDGFKFVEVSEPDLIAQHIGGTAIQTKEILDKARGGVLFIDEAYTLHKKDGTSFGQEAINTIMKYLEDYRNEIMIIFAGYTKEMEKFLKTNPGLLSRVPNRFVFEDYSAKEIVHLGEQLLEQDQFQLEDKEYYSQQVTKSYNRSLDKSNGRWIRNFNELLMKAQFSRVVNSNCDDVVTILNEDVDAVIGIGSFDESNNSSNALQELQNLIGIQKVKQQVQEFIYQTEANKKKEEMGIGVNAFTLHSLFLGNPGTGKTTVARIIGKILYQKGLISTNKFFEVSRSDLVAGFVGQTAIKTREVLESALGGVLFIDEAYTLNSSGGNDFGKEAIEEILKFMEDHRQDIVIIFAGYTNEMEEFLRINSGLKSRIPTVFDFEDYSSDEIVQIGLIGLRDYQFDKELYSKVVKQSYIASDDRSNGRWIRNFNDKLLRLQSARLIEAKLDSFDIISDEDINNTFIT